jgi:Ser/Thr protein kinase RdoA (MazF antagonist)
MARGWESKEVESQIESAESRRNAARAAQIDPAVAERARQRESWLLQRTRILHDLDRVKNQRHREQLEAALKHLEDKLAELSPDPPAGT